MTHPPEATGWSYSNTNYVLAGMLIESVTGRSWAAEVRGRILEPLGMRRTLTPGSWPLLPAPRATNYHRFAPGEPLVDTTIAIRGLDSGADGSMISTPSEVAIFFRALVDGRLLPPAQLRAMRDLVTIPADQGYPAGAGSGLGIFYAPLTCGGGYWGHGGNGFGYTVEPAVTAERSITVALFTGTFDPEEAQPRAEAVADVIDGALCRPDR